MTQLTVKKFVGMKCTSDIISNILALLGMIFCHFNWNQYSHKQLGSLQLTEQTIYTRLKYESKERPTAIFAIMQSRRWQIVKKVN